MFRRNANISRAESRVMSCPSSLMQPEVGRRRPSRCRSKVLFPDPLPPMMTMISPRYTCMLTPCRTSRLP